ncbi:hypothetical protein Dimus_026626 [Dionaea muscipula]
MAKRGRPKRVVPAKLSSDSSRKIVGDVGLGQVWSEMVGEAQELMSEKLGLDAEIDSVMDREANADLGALHDSGKPASPKEQTYLRAVKSRGPTWARKDGGIKQVKVGNTSTGGLPDVNNQAGVGKKDDWQVVNRRSRDRFRADNPDSMAKSFEKNILIDSGLASSDSLRQQCGLQPVTSDASTSHDSRSLECQGVE